ncbi:putative uncharacterized protein C19orf73 homolog [Parus major]|uniref:putative uncharacterized protein C19orf73 homolog n=1 Tax=Parus major TaxID=9157 RepID=UPI0007715B83|nr:putative uncharacterized protein C19orf73 homolog [Parus major]
MGEAGRYRRGTGVHGEKGQPAGGCEPARRREQAARSGRAARWGRRQVRARLAPLPPAAPGRLRLGGARLGAGGARRSLGSRSCLRMTPPRLRPPLPSPAAAAAAAGKVGLRHRRLLGGGDAVQRCGQVALAPRPVSPAPRLPPELAPSRRPPRAGVGPAPRP